MPSVTDVIELGSWWYFREYGLAVTFHITGWQEGCGFLGDLYIGPQNTKSIPITIYPPDFERLIANGDIREATDLEVRR